MNQNQPTSSSPKGSSDEGVCIYEDWNERDGLVFYRWSLDGKTWNEKLTAHKQKPVIRWKRITSKELEELPNPAPQPISGGTGDTSGMKDPIGTNGEQHHLDPAVEKALQKRNYKFLEDAPSSNEDAVDELRELMMTALHAYETTDMPLDRIVDEWVVRFNAHTQKAVTDALIKEHRQLADGSSAAGMVHTADFHHRRIAALTKDKEGKK